jgi:hypothetical protein
MGKRDDVARLTAERDRFEVLFHLWSCISAYQGDRSESRYVSTLMWMADYIDDDNVPADPTIVEFIHDVWACGTASIDDAEGRAEASRLRIT